MRKLASVVALGLTLLTTPAFGDTQRSYLGEMDPLAQKFKIPCRSLVRDVPVVNIFSGRTAHVLKLRTQSGYSAVRIPRGIPPVSSLTEKFRLFLADSGRFARHLERHSRQLNDNPIKGFDPYKSIDPNKSWLETELDRFRIMQTLNGPRLRSVTNIQDIYLGVEMEWIDGSRVSDNPQIEPAELLLGLIDMIETAWQKGYLIGELGDGNVLWVINENGVSLRPVGIDLIPRTRSAPLSPLQKKLLDQSYTVMEQKIADCARHSPSTASEVRERWNRLRSEYK